MNQYVLARKDILHSKVYECQSDGDVWYCETMYLEKATRYSLDDAMKQMNVTELVLSKNGSTCVGDILLFGKPIGRTWTTDIPSDQKVEIGSILKLDCVAELRTIRKKSSGNGYSIVITLSEYDNAYAFFTDEDFETSTKNNLLALYKVGDIAMTTKHHGGIFPFGIGADTLVDIINIDDMRGYSIKSRTLGITVREIGWVI